MDKEESLLGQVRSLDTGGGAHKGDENQLWNNPTGSKTPKDSNNPPPSPPPKPQPPPVQEPDYVNFSKKKDTRQ